MSEHVVTVSLQLRWGDMDINHHINNVVIARLFEESRVRAMPQLLAGGPVPQTDDVSAGSGLVVVRQEVEFLVSVPYTHDDITATVWLSRVGRSSFELSAVLTDAPGTRFAQAETTLVCVDGAGAPTPLAEGVVGVMRDRVLDPVGMRRRA